MVKNVRVNSADLLPCAIVERDARQVRVETNRRVVGRRRRHHQRRNCVICCGSRNDTGDNGPDLSLAPRNVPPTQHPMTCPKCLPTSPPPRPRGPSTLIASPAMRSACATWSSSGSFPLIRLSLALDLIGSESVVELVDHLCLVQRQHTTSPSFSNRSASNLPAGRHQLGPRAKQAGIIGHMEHAQESSGPMDSHRGHPPATAHPLAGTSPG